jgi:hypothetical protein
MSDLFSVDFQEFIGFLNECSVEYIVVGGFAVNVHGYQRSTGDVDIWVNQTTDNYAKLTAAFRLFGMPVFDMSLENFMSKSFDVFSYGRPPQAIDIITQLKGLAFEAVVDAAIYYHEAGLRIRVLHKNHLLIAKKASGRSKDLNDIEGLSSQ